MYPGIKDLPAHIREGFRNTYIRLVIRDVFNSEEPWINPDLPTLQRTYDATYPAYPARLQPNDAVFHPVRFENLDLLIAQLIPQIRQPLRSVLFATVSETRRYSRFNVTF